MSWMYGPKLMRNIFSFNIFIQSGEGKIAEILMQHGADINAETKEKYTPIYFAALFGK